MIAGFRKTGIHPLCAEKVLEQVPQTEEEEYANSNVGNAINQSFEVYMKQLFQKETQPLKKARKKKLNIPPGKSVENMSFSDDSSREDDPDDKFNGNEEEVTEKASLPWTQALPSATAQERFELKDLKEGGFIVAKFEYHGQKGMKVQKHYIGKILLVTDSIIEASFMRKSNKIDGVYLFPQEPDIEEIELSQVVSIVQPKSVRRSRYYFDYKFAE